MLIYAMILSESTQPKGKFEFWPGVIKSEICSVLFLHGPSKEMVIFKNK